MDHENKNLGFSIGFWDINGLSKENSENYIYQKYIYKIDIIFLSRTSNSETSLNRLKHRLCYLDVNVCRKSKNKKGQASERVF